MFHLKRYFSLFLLISLCFTLLTGCQTSSKTTSSQSNIPMGRYIEQDWDVKALTEDGQIYDFFPNAKGDLQVYVKTSNNDLKLYTSPDNHSFEETPLPWADDFRKIASTVELIVQNQPGDTFILKNAIDKEGAIIYKAEGNTLNPIPIQWATGDKGLTPLRHFEVTSEGNIVVKQNGIDAMTYDGKTGACLNKFSGTFNEFVISGDYLIAPDIEAHTIVTYDVNTAKLLSQISYPKMTDNCSIIKGDVPGSAYIIDQEGINYLAKNGTVLQGIVDGSLTSLGIPSRFLDTISFAHNEFFMDLSESHLDTYKRLTYSATTPTYPTTELTAYALRDSGYLRSTLGNYQLSHPDVHIKLIIGVDNSETITEADAINALNTELLSHKGPDLILLDGLPYEGYNKQGILADINDVILPLTEKGELLTNVAKAYQNDGKIFAVSSRFMLPILGGNSKILSQSSTTLDFAKYKLTHPDQQLFTNKPPKILLKQFYTMAYPTWFDEDHQLNKEAIRSFLESIQTLSNDGCKIKEYDWDKVFKLTDYFDDEDHYYIGSTNLYYVVCDTPGALQDIFYVNESRTPSTYMPAHNDSSNFFEPCCLFSINASSKHLDIAKDIVKSALSEDIQYTITHNTSRNEGFPINKSALKKWFNGDTVWVNRRHEKVSSFIYRDANDQIQNQLIPWGYEENMYKLYTYCDTLSTPMVKNKQLLNIIVNESADYYAGKATLDEATNAVYDKLHLYLNE